MRRSVVAALVALLVVSAGCLGATGGSGTATAGDGESDAGDGASGDRTGVDGGGGGAAGDGTSAPVDGSAGTVAFYVSDRPNDMDDFEHLNVTITSVRFHMVDPADDTVGTANGTDPNRTDVNGTVAATPANDTVTATPTPTPTVATVGDDADDENGTGVDESAGPPDGEPGADDRAGERDDRDDEDEEVEDENDDRDDEGEDGRWVVRDVDATTVDLTRLRGDNATLVEEFSLPAGEYDTVFLEVSETDGTLKGGESTRVKLPSERLQLHTGFAVENGSETDFVYDISVHKAGKSGKYILRPVVSESGVGQPIDPVDEREREDEAEGEGEGEGEGDLRASFVGSVGPGENATVRVTDADGPVANATVTVDGGPEGTTNADGEFVFAVPEDAEEIEVEIEVEAGDAEAELEREWDDEETEAGDESDDGSNGDGGPGGQGSASPGNGQNDGSQGDEGESET